MALVAGDRLGPYEIEAKLGAGGMGEVWKARDTRLNRAVAVKVLADALTADPALRARFEREVRAVAALSHPHICAVYDVGSDNGVSYFVMEYLEGTTLAERLARRGSATSTGSHPSMSTHPRSSARGPLPFDHVLRYGIQIAEALEAAHRQGIVHRDLKPANVMLTKAGVKLLDFGLARVEAAGEPGAAANEKGPGSALSTKPSLTGEATVLGTMPYMAPEQLEGRPTDARTDIFALAAVLYEMIAGRRPFEGKSQASLIAAILEHDPVPLVVHQPSVPTALDRLIRECLAKDAEDRWQSAGDVRRELERLSDEAPAERARRRGNVLVPAMAVAAAAAIASLAAGLWLGRRSAPRPVVVAPAVRPAVLRVDLAIEGRSAATPQLAVSPDGRRLAYVSDDRATKSAIWVRALAEPNAGVIAGTHEARWPFWSPDGRSIAYAETSRSGWIVRVVELASGSTRTVARLPGRFTGGDWLSDGTLLLGSDPGGVVRVRAAGGDPTPVLTAARAEGRRIVAPRALPGGRFMFLDLGVAGSGEAPGLYAASLAGGDPTLLYDTRAAAVFADGRLLFVRGGSLFVAPLDGSGTATRQPKLLAEGVAFDPLYGNVALAAGGPLLVYASRHVDVRQLAWVDAAGNVEATVGDPGEIESFDVAGDGARVAFARVDPEASLESLWIHDGRRGGTQLLAQFDGVPLNDPVWSPDGQRVAYTIRRGNNGAIVARSLTGGPEEVLLAPDHGVAVMEDWSRDGRTIAFALRPEEDGVTQLGGVMALDGDRKPVLFGEASHHIDEPHLSPDARYVAYHANDSGRFEVYVTAVPPGGQRWQVSSNGGVQPRWRPDGKALFYLSPDGTLMSVELKLGRSSDVGVPRRLFPTRLDRPSSIHDDYGVRADGRGFLFRLPVAAERPPTLHLIENWTAAASGE